MLAEPETGALALSTGAVIAFAALALLGVAIYLRRLHRHDELMSVNGAAGIVSAAGIVACALVISAALGTAGVATSDEAGVSAQPTPRAELVLDVDTLQLPTLAD